jgi:hypothetical protein
MTHSNSNHASESFQKNILEKNNFQTHQLAFTHWIRHPNNAPLPNRVSAQRMMIYRELVFNNISSFIEHTYPVTQALLPPEIWQSLIDAFFQHGQCNSPYYYDISLHFKDFLDQNLSNPQALNNEKNIVSLQSLHENFPWLRELIQYEWMELYVDMIDVMWLGDSVTSYDIDHELFTSEHSLTLKTTCWLLAYQYPVHTWTTSTSLREIQSTPTCLLIYRDQRYEIQIHTLHPLWAFFIETMQSQEISDFSTLTLQLQKTTQLTKDVIDETLINLLNWLKKLTLLQVIPTVLNAE